MPQELQVVKSNHIISASYRLSAVEQRLILSCIAQVRRNEEITDEVLYSVTAAEFAKLCGTDQKTAYRDLAAAADRLLERRITIMFEPNGEARPERKRRTVWVQTADYIEKEGRVELRFGKDILPFLTGLTEQFTRYALSAVSNMSSAYAIRLFELLAQFGSVGSREISVEQLRDWFQLEDRYPLMADLRRWVIEPAVAQVNEHSPLAVKWEQRKTGRKVTHLVFTFGPKKTTKPAAKGANTALTPADMTDTEMAAHARPGETWEQLRARLRKAGTAA